MLVTLHRTASVCYFIPDVQVSSMAVLMMSFGLSHGAQRFKVRGRTRTFTGAAIALTILVKRGSLKNRKPPGTSSLKTMRVRILC